MTIDDYMSKHYLMTKEMAALCNVSRGYLYEIRKGNRRGTKAFPRIASHIEKVTNGEVSAQELISGIFKA